MSDEGQGIPLGKRMGPEDVPPLTLGNTRYEVIHWGKDRGLGQNGGYIAAIDIASGEELWTLRITASITIRCWRRTFKIFILKEQFRTVL